MVRLFSGAMVPLYFFPDNIEKILRLAPFQAMVFGPANALTINSFSESLIFDLGIAFFWSFALIIVSNLIWNFSIKKYEAVGI
jgi:ABC-2 type transport system permease protein